MHLNAVTFDDVKPLYKSFHDKTGYYDIPSGSEFIGIYEQDVLAGYFLILRYVDKSVDIVHGYLEPVYQHKRNSKASLMILEALLKRDGFTTVRCLAQRSLRGYIRFMDGLGYKPERIVFRKEL